MRIYDLGSFEEGTVIVIASTVAIASSSWFARTMSNLFAANPGLRKLLLLGVRRGYENRHYLITLRIVGCLGYLVAAMFFQLALSRP